MDHLHELSPDTTDLHWSELAYGTATQSILAVALALGIGLLAHHRAAGAVAAGGALTVGFASFNRVFGSPVATMLLAAAGMSVSAWIGMLAGTSTWALVLVAAVWGFAGGLLVAAGRNTNWLGMQCTIAMIVSGYFPLGPHLASSRPLLVLGGGILQVAVSAAWVWLRSRGLHPYAVLHHVPDEVRSGLVRLKTGLHPRSTPFQHALRVAFVLAAGTSIYRAAHVRNGYWIPMTALLVLKPEWGNTRSRGVARLAGTLLGAALAMLLSDLTRPGALALALLATVFAWGSYSTQGVNYALFSVCITAYIVFLLAFAGLAEPEAALLRAVCTVAGGLLAFLVKALWPDPAQPAPNPAGVRARA